jgi:hypothetical protein
MVIVLNVELLPQIKVMDVTMSAKNIISIAVAVLIFLWSAGFFGQIPLACADYYRYTDNRGVICITNNLNAIPPKYRSTMKTIREDKPGRQDKGGLTQSHPGGAPVIREPEGAGHDRHAATPSQSDSRLKLLMARFPLIKLLLLIAGIVATAIIIVKFTSLIPSPQLARLINIVFFLGLFVFAYKMYADNLVGNYFIIKTKVMGLFSRAMVREAPETGGKPPDIAGENTVK